MDIKKVAQPPAPLTPEQQQALARLRQAAQGLEGVFVGMLMREMRKTAPDASIFGKTSASEQAFSQMLDQQRADQIAKSGSFGMARMIESELQASVLADARQEAKGKRVEGEF
ncbi:MAG TPA: rod-binding protein [Candidatus Dormibacteraeota bacterium]|nr:rod-binding protein [Candidatus Dormibacteraeota bacterium]